ncbi:MAG: CopG family transcriptional regulator [Candidatus Gottesmanbacteria bacterium]|nr:CopG family transcriptional regulator [Candidatus Gottesmanbacteria bacterium]
MMIRTQVYLPEELHRDLKLLAAARMVNYSTLIRAGVARVLKDDQAKMKNSDAWKSFIGAGGKGGPKDVASRIDYYLYGGGSKWAKIK